MTFTMATGSSEKKSYKDPPSWNDYNYVRWTQEVEVWKCLTTLSVEKLGPALYTTLSEKTKEAVLVDLTLTNLKSVIDYIFG